MKYETYTFEQLVIYALALALAIAIAFVPTTVRSGAYEAHPQGGVKSYVGPRWSNDHQIEDGLIVRPGCVTLPPGASADYVPGRDAYGRPVTPAEPPKGFANSFPMGVGLDVDLGTKHVGGKDIEMHGGLLTFDPATNGLALNGHVWQRDCLPPPK